MSPYLTEYNTKLTFSTDPSNHGNSTQANTQSRHFKNNVSTGMNSMGNTGTNSAAANQKLAAAAAKKSNFAQLVNTIMANPFKVSKHLNTDSYMARATIRPANSVYGRKAAKSTSLKRYK